MNVNVVFVLCMTASVVCSQLLNPFDTKPQNPYIIGGMDAQAGDIPWIVSLSARQWSYTHFCGGSLLDSRTILTAAHCVKKINLLTDGLKVRIASLILNTGGNQYVVTEIRVHNNYDPNTFTNDVAILKVATDMIVSGNIDGIPVSTVQLPTGGKLADGTVVTVAGWGYTNPSGPALSTKLQKVKVPMVNWFMCNIRYSFSITSEMVCAGKKGQDSCSGDSGGPLTYGNVIYGIVSWGVFPCANPNKPGVYSDVVALLGWINANRG